jgi:hypothetical protein
MDRKRPPIVADERTQLTGWLDLQRAIVQLKCEGVSEADAHRAVLPASPLMTMAAVVSHLRWAEHLWFNVLFLGEPATGPMFDSDEEDGDMIRLLRGCGFEVEDLIEIQPPPDATTRHPLASLEWARQWPCEEVWKARKTHP